MKVGLPGSKAEASARSLLSFLNTRPCPACRAGEGLTPEPGSAGAGDDLHRGRDDLIALLEARLDGTRPPQDLLGRINRRLRRATPVPQLAWAGGTIHLRAFPFRTGRRPAPEPEIPIEWILMVADPRVPIDRCAATGCRHYLLRRRSNRRWCSPEGCGNRARVARHHLKVRRASWSIHPGGRRLRRAP